ncbi:MULTISPECIES: hypothetical protein [unclassified Haloferax]|uniref:hypothetical protein n=1 Tax=unclassified Haloferax TaxID=2625095 RepID=UPI0011C01F4C|nr:MULTISPECIES: hypothetical protein [unclassified Haloferax]
MEEEQNDGEDEAGNNTESNDQPTYDIETYRHAIEDARRTHDQQLDAYNDIGEKAWRIVRLNGLVATIYVAAVANAFSGVTFPRCALLSVVLGFVSLLASTLFAMYGQQQRTVSVGQSPESFEMVRKHDPDEITYLYETLNGYEQWITDVRKKTSANGSAVNVAKSLFLTGVGLITIGTLLATVL